MSFDAEAADESLATAEGRRLAQDRLDTSIGEWVANHDAEVVVERLRTRGVPAAIAVDHRIASFHEQMIARGFFETIEHPVVGSHPTPTMPFRYRSVPKWLRAPAPTIGQHNAEILGDFLGHSAEELNALESAGVIGTRPQGV
jgi:crotonobetainyl-CoA:carnitine CoA-transferase CaiB-like acyl-CoA transferase